MYKWEAGDVGISGQNEEEERKEGRKEGRWIGLIHQSERGQRAQSGRGGEMVQVHKSLCGMARASDTTFIESKSRAYSI